MANIHWKGAVSADFNTAADWSTGTVPGASDNAILDAKGMAFTVSTSTGETVSSIQLASNATLDIGARTFTATKGTGSGANAGVINIENNEFFAVGGTVDNTGAITLDSVGNTTEFSFSANTTLTGAGQVTLSDNANNLILGVAATTSLTNVGNTISGSGQLGDGQMTFINQAAGVVEATGSSNALILNTGVQSVTNAGLLEGAGGAGLTIQSTTVSNTGTLLAAMGSAVNLQSADIQGGTLATTGTGVIQAVDRGSVLDGTASAVKNTGVLDILNNEFLTVQGSIANTGSINLDSGGNTTELDVGAAGVTLTGAGQVTLTDNGNNLVLGDTAASTLTNVNNTIAGSGQLGDGQMTFVNQVGGLVEATGAGNALVLNTGAQTVINAGLLESAGSAGLTIASTTVSNTGTLLAASGDALTLQNADIQGGTLATAGSGVIQAVYRGSVLDGTASAVNNTGVLDILNNQSLTIQGAIVSTGSVNLDSGGNTTELDIGAAGVTLTGAGQVTLTDNGNNLVLGDTAASTLTNVNNTIAGSGQLGDGQMTFVNQAKGLVEATGTNNALVLNTGAQTVINAGLLEAIGSAGLSIQSTTVSNTGTLLAATGSAVDLQSADIQGGVLATAGTGVVQVVDRGTVLDGTAASVSNTGVFDVTNNNWVYLQGVIANAKGATINMQSVGNDTRIIATAANATITGGAVILSDNPNNTIQGTISGPSGSQVASTLTNKTTISGAGLIGNASLTLVNDKTIDATGANALIIDVGGGNFASSTTVTNAGLLEATNPGKLTSTGGLDIRSDVIANGTVGVIEANGAATHVDLQSSTIQGGTLATANGGVIETAASDRGSVLDGTANAVNNTGVLDVTNNAWLYLQGAIDNTGTINVQSVGNDTRLRMNANTVLTGGGPIVLTDNNNNTIDAVSAATTLTNVSSTISGAGAFGNASLTFINDAAGVVDATGTNYALIINTSGETLTNLGLIEATGAAGMAIVYTLVDDTGGGTISAGNGSDVSLQSSTIAGGTLATSGTGVIETAGADRGSILDGTTSAVNITGVVDVTNNAWLYLQGTIDNTGTINVLSVGNDTRLRVNENTVLTGGGPIVMSDNVNNSIDAATAGLSLTNVSSTISGAGNIGQTDLLLINDTAGVIDATGANALTLQTGTYIVANSGLIEATGAGGMLIYYSTVNDSTGGTISASNGSTVTLQSSDIIGGTLSSAGAGVLQTAGADRGSVLDGLTAPLTLAGTFNVTNNAWLYVQGTIDNTGTINIGSVGNDTRLRMDANTVFTGGGPIVMSDNTNNSIDANAAGLSLTNVSSTISGAGNIGQGDLLLINDKAGVINGNGTNTLTLYTGSYTVANGGLIEATGAGGLLIYYSTVDGSTGGTITAGNGSTVTLQSSTIIGGTLASTGSGSFQINDRGSTLDGLTSTVNNAATFDVSNNQYLYIEGTIDNTGSINLDSVGNDTRLRLAANTVLTGDGVVDLNGNANNTFEGESTGLTLTNDGNTLEGSGNLFGGASLIFINGAGGVVDGNGTTALVLSTPGSTITNEGTLEGTGSGGLTISDAVIAGKGGTIFAGAGSGVTLSSTTVTGGFMSTAATGVITLANGSTATLDGVTGDAGTILVDSTGKATSLIFDMNTSLSGAGVLELSANKNNIVEGTKTSVMLTNLDDTIEGAGKLGDNKLILVNDAAGVIDADSKLGLTLGTKTNTIVNAGLIEATSKGKGVISSAVDNTGTLAAAGGTLTVNGPVSGAGSAIIDDATLTFGSSFYENVAFTGITGKLTLAESQSYTGQISGFSLKGRTSLDLKDIGFVSASEATFSGTTAGGVLTVTDGTHTAHINMIGNYTNSTFVASSDGHGGVLVKDPPAPNAPSLHAFVAAMAALPTSAPAVAGPASVSSGNAPLTLIAPGGHPHTV